MQDVLLRLYLSLLRVFAMFTEKGEEEATATFDGGDPYSEGGGPKAAVLAGLEHLRERHPEEDGSVTSGRRGGGRPRR